jgi:hypothetical protein
MTEHGGMRVCDRHWNLLKDAIEKRGLSHLIAKSGVEAARNMAAELQGEDTLANYDPLMASHWAIVGNCMDLIGKAGGDPLYLMGATDDPVVGYGKQYEDRTWPHCPLCYVNLAHEVSCGGCPLDQEHGFDFWIDRAADGQVERVKRLTAGADQ